MGDIMIITFAGHSLLTEKDELSKAVRQIITEIIKKADKVSFYCGGYGDFDMICQGVCRSVKKDFPNCETVFVTPYMTDSQQKKIDCLLENRVYDAVIYPPLESVPLKYAISRRNKWMVDSADLIIAYVKYKSGGSYKTLQYAVRRNKTVINLADIKSGENNKEQAR